MTTAPAYQFRSERVIAVLHAHATDVDDRVVEDAVEEATGRYVDRMLTLFAGDLPALAAAITDVGIGPDPRATDRHAEALDRLARHDGCASDLNALVAQRDDAIDALLQARHYCRNDTYAGKYGDRNLSIEGVLDSVRPTLPDEGRYRSLLDPDNCDECDGSLFLHGDDCPREARREQLVQRRAHAIASHLLCADMGKILIDQIGAALERCEQVAHQVHAHQTYAEDDGMVIRPDRLLPALRLAELNVPFDPANPPTIAAARHIDIE